MTTPALARTALARLRASITCSEDTAPHHDANAAEVMSAIDAWEKATETANANAYAESAARIAELEAAQKWQPIASAPEGEHVLVHHPKWPIQPVRIGLLLNGCGDFVDDHNNAIAPTHWAPLPAAPKGTP